MLFIKNINNENEIKKLFKFLTIIPEDTLNASIEKLSFVNRMDRRKYDKYKTLNEKLKFLVNSVYRCTIIENINEILNKNISMTSESTYEEILSYYNKDNCVDYTVYMLHRCCDDGFDQKYFSDFIKSEQFIKTVNNSWIESNNEKKLMLVEGSNFEPKLTISNQNQNKGEHVMNCYLGLIELRGTFYNFKPQYILNDNESFSEISKSQLGEDFPIYGSLNLAYKMYGKSHNILTELNIDRSSDESFPHKGLYAICFNNDELTVNDNDKIQLKIDLQTMSDNGINLNDRIMPLHKVNVYKIVTPQSNTNIIEMFNTSIPINEDFDSNEIVLLDRNDGRLYGPYVINERSIDGLKYIQPDVNSHKYIIKCYNIFNKFEIENQPNMKDPIYTDLATIDMESEEKVDVIPNSILLNKLQDKIDTELLREDPEEFERLCSNSPFLGKIPNDIRKARVDKIKSIINNAVIFEDEKRAAIISLINHSGDEIQTLLGENIEKSPIYKNKIIEIDDLKRDISQKSDEISKLNALVQASNMPILDNNAETLEQMRKEEEEIKSSINNLKNEKQDLTLIADLKDEIKYSDRRVEELKEEKTKLEQQCTSLQSQVKEAISKGVTDAAQNAFDPFISNAMIEAAGQWRSEIEDEKYKTIAEKMSSRICNNIEKESLIDNLVAEIKKFRNYSKNDIINMFICLSQNFITIFSGEPGTGKTSICNILANSLGLNTLESYNGISMNRYVPVSVERGWSSKRDLIGYYNPLTKKYDRSNVKIYDALMILNQERENSRFPYIILLDEANLSPIEYYWADFMRVADKSQDNEFINIGLDMDMYIPKTLRFLATINNDQTTEQLSPRLIDRSWIVRLPKCDLKEISDNISYCFDSPILWSDIKKVFISSESKDVQLKTPVEQIYKLFNDNRLSVSPRIQQSIKNYICVAQEIMEDEIGVNKKEKALDFAIVQKLLPKINGYYSNYERLFKSLLLICEENHLKMTKASLTSMQEYQEQNMGYCQYLI